MIELGGSIRLEGFEALDPAELLIAKKLVGSYVRRVCDEAGECERAIISLKKDAKGFVIAVEMMVKGSLTRADAAGDNVFMTIDQALKATLQKLGVAIA